MKLQENKGPSGFCFDQPKENIPRSESSCSIDLTQYKKGSLEIKTESENLSSRQGSFDFNSLLNSRPSIYTRTLQKMESFKRTALSVVGNNSQGDYTDSCHLNTCESRPENPREIYSTVSTGPRSVPSKKQSEESLREREGNFGKLQASNFELVKEVSPERSAEVGEESATKAYQEKIAKLSKDNRDMRRKLNKQAQEHAKQLEELKEQHKAEVEELKAEIERKVLEANRESDIVAESMKEQLEYEVKKNEELIQQAAELEQQLSDLKEQQAAAKENESSKQEAEALRKEIERLKTHYEDKISELQECHIEGELASAVALSLTVGGDEFAKEAIGRAEERASTQGGSGKCGRYRRGSERFGDTGREHREDQVHK
eukprot:TRINITY_DN8588_c0_g2_i22.p1 TRINITY_DN8588_c0_g2~~TRINITY_DN8588_c0_g2_i22.p1  ORF type:complete len:374 (-),score=126.59 TRINITY_DN8588_c0_g2_i22:258-1379(-)